VDAELIERLRDALRGGPSLRLAIAFGSVARGRARRDSDLDIAILPVDTEMTLREEAGLIDELERASGRSVDLVRLDRASPFLIRQVARDGVVIVSDPPHEAPRFRARAAIDQDENSELEDDAARRYRAALARSAGPR
jgi:predicted nucleotidyltransferase